MSFYDLQTFPAPNKICNCSADGDTRIPYERIKAYDDKEFELFIREWVSSLPSTYDVRGFGGAGDKGRDVVAKDTNGNYYYYQCKHYNHPLTPTDIYPEFAKLVYFTFNHTIPIPKAYYILAPQDIGAKLHDLIEAPTKISAALIENWDKHCQSHICSNSISLSDELKQYLKNFDFSIIKTKTMLEIVEEHKKTAFYAFRFGGGLTVQRERPAPIPTDISAIETTYIKKILQAISEKLKIANLSLDKLKTDYSEYLNTIVVNRERFYSAENLKLFTQKHMLTNEYFYDLCDDIFYGIFDYFEQTYTDGYERMNTILSEVTKIDFSNNLLVKYGLVHPQDKQGICHHLANNKEELIWTNKK